MLHVLHFHAYFLFLYHLICICNQLYVIDYLLYIIILHQFKIFMGDLIYSVQKYPTNGTVGLVNH